jgi:hypothetical protein
MMLMSMEKSFVYRRSRVRWVRLQRRWLQPESVSRLRRLLVAIICGCIAGVLAWRGCTYTDGHAGMTVPLMCTAAALAIAVTGLAILIRADDNDAPFGVSESP